MSTGMSIYSQVHFRTISFLSAVFGTLSLYLLILDDSLSFNYPFKTFVLRSRVLHLYLIFELENMFGFFS